MSRTTKCRRHGNDSAVTSTNCAAVLSFDEGLLVELRELCAQSLETTYRRKLEAVALLLQQSDQRTIEHRAKASLRTVQRWSKRARRFGCGALRGRAHAQQTSKLSDEWRTRLAADLQRPPVSLGYAQSHWTAALLLTHIRENYGVTFSLRHCRRLLSALGVAERPASAAARETRRLAESTTAAHQELIVSHPMGDYARKRRALVGIKRLASLGMPLQPFAYTLFDLVHDAVPYDEASPGLAATSNEGSRWIVRDFDYERWFPQVQKYLLDASPEISGFRPPSLLPQNPRTVLRHEEIVCPNYYRSEGYNEFFRSMEMHHGLLTLLRDEHGSFLGYYPIFRSERMKPFSRDEVSFLEVAAADIARGVSTAGLVAFQPADEDCFEPFRQVPLGIVVMDRTGRVLSLNKAANALFRQFAIYDNWGTRVAANGGLSAALRYIARQLRAIFGNRDETSIEAGQPVVRIYSHRSGAILRLRGLISDLGENGGHFTVLIELGETESLLRLRLSSRYQLSRRQAELLMLLRRGINNKEIAERLDAGRLALKSSLRELRLKLALSDRTSLREFARVISPYSMSAPPPR
ncbi:MAG: helix-turn-helix domain-containing protein [Deltaproteobacteria bacterium]|nr:helix-turn-helix domain-containing protein [Deltaproteobacteria bacterium]